MKKLGFLLVGTAALALAACGRNAADTLNEAEAQNVEAEALNDLAANAANEAENTAAEEAETVDGNETSPSEVEDDVQGM